jgi:penicillin-binding protein 2
MRDSFPGSGDVTVPIDPANWEIITDGMAAVTGPSGTAFAYHLNDIDIAGKTGTAQVVNHSFGDKTVSSVKAERANAWFVGMAPRRNPDIVVAVFWQHGGWGNVSAPIAERVIEAFVDKQRRLNNNLVAEKPQPVEVGAIWSQPDHPGELGGKPIDPHARKGDELESAYAGHFFIDMPKKSEAAKPVALAAAVR